MKVSKDRKGGKGKTGEKGGAEREEGEREKGGQ